MTLHYPDPESHRSRMTTARQWVTTQATGPMARFLPRLEQRKQQFDLLFDAFEEGDRPLRAAMTMALIAPPEEMTRALSNARVYFRELGFQLQEEKFIALPLFLNLLPLGADRTYVMQSQRFRTLATRQVIAMLPLFADWPGSGGRMLSLISRSGEAMRFSLFDSPTNYNASIAAQSGSGKSFLTNEIIVRSLADGARVWVIDIGRSYQNLCEQLQGEFIAFGSAAELSLNPFDLMKDWKEDADLIAGLFAAMVAPSESLNDFQMATLKRTLRSLHDATPGKVTIDQVEQALLGDPDPRVRDLGTQLYPFTLRGEYGSYFSEGKAIRFNNPFTVLELEELKGRRHLQKVVLLLLILQIQKAMIESPRDQRKIVIIDESWELLTEGDAASFIESGYRRFRKYGGSAITLTQSVNDLYRSSAGRAIVENSAHLLLLGQKSEAVELLRREDRLSIGEAGYALLKSVHTIPGAYSEIFIHGETGSGIGRLVVDPFKRLLFSTRPDDIARLKRMKDSGLDLEDAILQCIQQRDRAA
jgi:conjugal transfer ATP-binding protein TraC